MKKISAATLLLSLSVTACNKKSEDETTPAPVVAENPTADIATGNAVMNTISTSLTSLSAAASGSLVAAALRLESGASGNPLCTEHGMPMKAGLSKSKGDAITNDDMLPQNDPNYASSLFVCLSTLAPSDGASVETLLGSLAQTQSVLCSFEEAFGTFEYTTAGTNLVAGGSKVAALSTACWPNGAPDGLTEITFTEGVATALDASTGYEKKLAFKGTYQMGGETGEVGETLYFFNKDGIIGFKNTSEGGGTAAGGSTQISFDTVTGQITVNIIDDRGGAGGADSAYRRLVRMKIKGTLSDALAFTGIESMQGIFANSGRVDEGDTTQDASSSIVSLKGDSTNGYYGSVWLFNDSVGTETYKGCTGVNQSCTADAIDELVITEAGNTSFYKSASRTAWKAQVATGLPTCFSSDDITFDAAPKMGAFGVCE